MEVDLFVVVLQLRRLPLHGRVLRSTLNSRRRVLCRMQWGVKVLVEGSARHGSSLLTFEYLLMTRLVGGLICNQNRLKLQETDENSLVDSKNPPYTQSTSC